MRARAYNHYPVTEKLTPGATPTQSHELSLEQVDDARRMLCRYQGSCIAYAMSEGWNGLSCKKCKISEELSREEQHFDLEGLSRLLRALDLPTVGYG